MSVDMPRSHQAAPTLADLRAARDVLRDAPVPGGHFVAAALDAILRGEDPHGALGLKSGIGRRSALTVDRLRTRDALIRSLATRYHGGLSASEAARRIAASAESYWRRAAQLDRSLDVMPGSYAGSPRELLFHLARLPSDMPGERTIRAILAAPNDAAAGDPQSGSEGHLFAASEASDIVDAATIPAV